jgi:2-methylcitrate dehydratase PrpD
MPATLAPVTVELAHFIVEHDVQTSELYTRATRALIDTVGVAIAGGTEPSFVILEHSLGHESGSATVLATGARASASQAALLNGTAGHALDFDDVADEMLGHPSVVLIAALLGLAETRAASGRQLLEAYAIGFDSTCAAARALPVERHYTTGWHATATVGILGATAGAARLLGLDLDRTRHALGIAASMASGSRQNFGTMTKPLHAGLAARDAVLAAELAANGFTADPDQLDGPLGYFRLFGDASTRPEAVAEALREPSVLLSKGLNVKKYPCCYQTHRIADAMLALREQSLDAEQVRAVAVTVQPGGQQAIIHHRPTTGLQGKFSAEYVVAAALLDGHVNLRSFTDEAVQRPAAQSLLTRVALHETDTPPFGQPSYDHAYATLEVTLADGTVRRERCDVPRGDARMPLSDAELDQKFRDCLAFAGSEWDADDLLGRLRAIEQVERVALLSA